MRRMPVLAATLTCAVFAASCGGGGEADPTSESAADAPGTTAAPTTTLAPTTTTVAAAPTTTAPTTTTTTTTTTTAPPAVSLPSVTTGDLPTLIPQWGSGTGDPLDLAQRLIGFPLDIAPPGATSPADVDLRLRITDDGNWRWEWQYSAYAAAGTVQEIDAELPEGGPGTIEGRLYYDPLFEALGWRNVSQVISDPSSGGGGPQSVNWAYNDTDGLLQIGAIAAEPTSARAWVDEDLGFGESEGTPGHRLEINALVPVGTIPVPLIAGLLNDLPPVDGELLDLSLRSATRDGDSFDAEAGLRYLDLSIEWRTTANDPEAAGTQYAATLPNAVLKVGEESFFDEGTIEVRDPLIGGVSGWRQSVLLLDRYPGTISFDLEDDGTVVAELRLRFEPNRAVLVPAEG